MNFLYKLFPFLKKKETPKIAKKSKHFYYRLTEEDAKDVDTMLARKHATNILESQGSDWTAESEFQ